MKDNKRIFNASSVDNGIIFYSSIVPNIGVKTYYNESGEIKSRYISKREEILEITRETLKYNWGRILSIAHISIIFIGLIAYLCTNNIALWMLALSIIFTGVYENIIYMLVTFKEFKTKKGKKRPLARFHAAEHMSINVYNKIHRVPTYEEVEKESRFSKYCGSMKSFNETFLKIIQCIIFYLLSINGQNIFLKIKSIAIEVNVTIGYYVVLISMIVIVFLLTFIGYYTIKLIIERNALLTFMEVLYTEKPGEREINLAIKGIENYELMEKRLKEMSKAIVIDVKNRAVLEVFDKEKI